MAKKANNKASLAKIDLHSSREELLAVPEIAQAIEDGHLIVFDIIDSKNNENFVNVFFVGSVELASESSKLSKYALKMLGFNRRIERAIQPMSREVVEDLDIEKGFVDTEAKIRVIDSLEPAFDNHNARETSEGEALVDRETGEPVYRTAQIVFEDEFEALGGHKTIRVMTEEQWEEENSKTTSKSKSRVSSKDVVE